MTEQFTRIPYQYRDAANYKIGGDIYLEGLLSADDLEKIKSKLDSGEYFIPDDLQLGIAELQDQLTSFPSEDDHVYHELKLSELEVLELVPAGTQTIPAPDFVKAFDVLIQYSAWDVAKAMTRLGL